MIGAGSGALILGLPVGIAVGTTDYDPRGDEIQFYGAKNGATLGILGALVGGLIGSGVGAAIGACVPKKSTQQDVSITPIINATDRESLYGLSVAYNF